jgi:hypothetical protein
MQLTLEQAFDMLKPGLPVLCSGYDGQMYVHGFQRREPLKDSVVHVYGTTTHIIPVRLSAVMAVTVGVERQVADDGPPKSEVRVSPVKDFNLLYAQRRWVVRFAPKDTSRPAHYLIRYKEGGGGSTLDTTEALRDAAHMPAREACNVVERSSTPMAYNRGQVYLVLTASEAKVVQARFIRTEGAAHFVLYRDVEEAFADVDFEA